MNNKHQGQIPNYDLHPHRHRVAQVINIQFSINMIQFMLTMRAFNPSSFKIFSSPDVKVFHRQRIMSRDGIKLFWQA